MRWLLVVCLVVVVAGGCGQRAEDDAKAAAGSEQDLSAVEKAAEKAEEAINAAETPEAKLAVALDFLDRYPVSEDTGTGFLDSAVYWLVEDLDRPEEAYELVEGILSQVEDPDTKLEVQMNLAILHSKTGRTEELEELALVMAREHDFQYTDYYQVMEMATKAEAWELAIDQADASLALATPEAFQAQYPDMTAEESEKGGRRRVAFSSGYKGWAQANLGRTEEAVATFAEAAPNTSYSFLGADETPLHLFWGKTLLLQGDAEGALEKLAVEAIHGDAEASEIYSQAWIAANGSEAGLEERLWTLREENAKSLPEFTLTDYDGNSLESSGFAGDVMVVVAWHPTRGGCRVELPRLESLWQQYREAGLQVIAIDSEHDTERSREFITENNLTYHLVEDTEGDDNVVGDKLEVFAFPTTYLVDRSGRIFYTHIGFEAGDEATIEEEIKRLL